MMNPEIKAAWIKELRSGEIPQTRGKLRRFGDVDAPGGTIPAGMCCLGVLCDLYARMTGKGWWDGSFPGVGPFVLNQQRHSCYLPEEVRQWAGLEDNDPEVGDFNLSELNDKGQTFSQIADVIEEKL